MGKKEDLMGVGIPAAAAQNLVFNWTTTEQAYPEEVAGVQVYAKTLSLGALPNNAAATTNHDIVTLADIVSIVVIADDGTRQYPAPVVNVDTLGNSIEVYVTQTTVRVDTNADFSTYTGRAYLKYTKA